MAGLSLLNAAFNATLNEIPNTSVSPGFCKRVRFRKSNCQRCVEVCPESVIALDPGPTIHNGCSDCGLCEKVCPMEVFRNEVHTDRFLLNLAESFLEKKTLTLCCHKAENQNGRSLPVLCLGRITENVILGIAVLGFEEFLLLSGICSQCRFRQGERSLKNSIAASRILLEGLGLGHFVIGIEGRVKKKEAVLSRRDIFSMISNKVKRGAATLANTNRRVIGENPTGGPERKESKRPSPRRELFRKILWQKDLGDSIVVKYSPDFPWGRIKMDHQKCSACGVCVALCPTGAISQTSGNERPIFYFNGSRCANCSLCKEVCPKKAIDFEEEFPLTDILDDGAKVMARGKLTSCILCGEMMTAEKGDLCFTCQKRQAWPMHAFNL